MVVGYGIITFRLHECHSLKEKRRIIKAVINQIDKAFNVSVAEVGSNDIHQRAEVGYAMVGNSRKLINSKIDKMMNMLDETGLAEIIDSEMEIFNL